MADEYFSYKEKPRSKYWHAVPDFWIDEMILDRLPRVPRNVLLFLNRCKNTKSFSTWVTVKTIREATGHKKESIARATNLLHEAGLIIKKRIYWRKKTRAVYTILLEPEKLDLNKIPIKERDFTPLKRRKDEKTGKFIAPEKRQKSQQEKGILQSPNREKGMHSVPTKKRDCIKNLNEQTFQEQNKKKFPIPSSTFIKEKDSPKDYSQDIKGLISAIGTKKREKVKVLDAGEKAFKEFFGMNEQ